MELLLFLMKNFDGSKVKFFKNHRELLFSKMAGMDKFREQMKENHAIVSRSLTSIQDELVIQSALSEDLDLRLIGLTSQIEMIRDSVSNMDNKMTKMAENSMETNERIKALEDLIRLFIQSQKPQPCLQCEGVSN